MKNLEIKFAKEHPCAVFFVECETSPEDFIFIFQKNLKSSPLEQALVICSFHLLEPWSGLSQILEISYLLLKKQESLVLEKVSIQNNLSLFSQKNGINFNFDNKIITINADVPFYLKIKSEFNLQKFIYKLNEPLFMQPVFIPKPWGQEIWYSGVEKRGVSKISTFSSLISIPLTYFFSALPKFLLGEKYFNKNLVLIKILDPLPDNVKGDLYYELHQEKNEVYIVTHIFGNNGRIKIGINQTKISYYQNNIDKLKEDFQ